MVSEIPTEDITDIQGIPSRWVEAIMRMMSRAPTVRLLFECGEVEETMSCFVSTPYKAIL